MDQVLIVRYGEITLKGLNRPYFENHLVKDIKNALRSIGIFSIVKRDQLIYIDILDYDPEPIVAKVTRVFGVVSVSVAERLSADMNRIAAVALQKVREYRARTGLKTFKVITKRANKAFPVTSPEISRVIGEFLLDNTEGIVVDVHQPDLSVYIEIRDQAYIYLNKIPGFGGMPYGTNGRALLLLSGGIDSPAAGWLMAKRGVAIEAVHFHSYPFTSERAKEKVIDLARILSGYCHSVPLHIINLLNIQQAIKEHCPEEIFTILSRRFMMFIAERIALQNSCLALITGESMGQVASQTIQNLHITNSAVSIPVFRPLIATDKNEIVNLAAKIGTYETSIQPYEDCCTIFLPKRPSTKPRLEKVLKHEANLDKEALIAAALETEETLTITPYYK
jgi:thiamine biosynthesis protein ThiI